MAQMAAENALTAEQSARLKTLSERHVREQRLKDRSPFMGPAITPEDHVAIVRDELDYSNDALEKVSAWRDRFHGLREGRHVPITVMMGIKGLGKTVAGAWLIAQEGGVYVSALELSKRLISGHWKDIEWSSEVVRNRVVVLDDVGTVQDDKSEVTALYEFVNRRQSLERGLTLITTNLGKEAFAERFGERTMVKLMHVAVLAEITGSDLRRKWE